MPSRRCQTPLHRPFKPLQCLPIAIFSRIFPSTCKALLFSYRPTSLLKRMFSQSYIDFFTLSMLNHQRPTKIRLSSQNYT